MSEHTPPPAAHDGPSERLWPHTDAAGEERMNAAVLGHGDATEADALDDFTAAELAELEQVCAAATAGEWEWYNGCSYWRLGIKGNQGKHDVVLRPTIDSDGHPNIDVSGADRVFIVVARRDLPRLVRALRAKMAVASDLSRQLHETTCALADVRDLAQAGLRLAEMVEAWDSNKTSEFTWLDMLDAARALQALGRGK